MDKKDLIWKGSYLAASGAAYLMDQVSKAWAYNKLRLSSDVSAISGFLNFSYAENTGVAFSQLQDGGDLGRYGLSGIAVIAAFAVLYFFWKIPRSNDRLLGALALLLAGILGNVTDRLRFGFVIDFIDVQFGGWHYPTFNVADALICIGAGLLLIDMFFSKKPEEAKTSAEN
jgi:signal peptidase II